MSFEYPVSPRTRRHHPAGYTTAEAYRPWLRDDFDFRCVYCLKRENWGQFSGEFDIDHFLPLSIHPEERLNYVNLVYACHRCNLVKRDMPTDDPALLTADRVWLLEDGSLKTNNQVLRRIIRALDLNSGQLTAWRLIWMRILAMAAQRDRELYHQLLGLPHDVPDLRRLRPPKNRRQSGVHDCWFVRRERGDPCLIL